MTPVLAVNTVRLFPSAATGLQLNVNEFDNFTLEAGHYTKQTGVDSSNSDDSQPTTPSNVEVLRSLMTQLVLLVAATNKEIYR